MASWRWLNRTTALLVCRADERDKVRVMRRLVASYVRIVAKTTRDLVPKIVMKSVVLHVERSLHGHLISSLLKCVFLCNGVFHFDGKLLLICWWGMAKAQQSMA